MSSGAQNEKVRIAAHASNSVPGAGFWRTLRDSLFHLFGRSDRLVYLHHRLVYRGLFTVRTRGG
jgi:hypothetical protein